MKPRRENQIELDGLKPGHAKIKVGSLCRYNLNQMWESSAQAMLASAWNVWGPADSVDYAIVIEYTICEAPKKWDATGNKITICKLFQQKRIFYSRLSALRFVK